MPQLLIVEDDAALAALLRTRGHDVAWASTAGEAPPAGRRPCGDGVGPRRLASALKVPANVTLVLLPPRARSFGIAAATFDSGARVLLFGDAPILA